MSADTFQPEHFRDVILTRMKELDLNNDTIGDSGGPSTTKMSSIRRPDPKPPRDDIYRKLDRALRWKKGSARKVAAGGSPTPLPPLEDLAQVIAAVKASNLEEPERSQVLAALGETEERYESDSRGQVQTGGA